MIKHRTFLFNLLCLLMAGSTSLFAADNPDFAPTGEAEDFTYLTCEYYNSGRWTSGDCRIVVCEGEYLKLSTLPNHYVPTWTGPNGFSYTGQNVDLGNVSANQAGEYEARYQTSSGHVLHTTITVDVLTEPTLTIEETHETCHGWDGALDLTVSDLPAGVFFELYEGHCSYLPEHFNTNYRDQSGISTTGFDISLAGLDNYFTLRFSATLTVPTTGTYTFYTNSDDGSKLYIDGVRIVNNDGYHGPRERSGNVHLTAGQHQIVVSYFEASGGELLQVKYKGPGISKRHIPTSALTVPYAVHWSNGACTEDLTGIDDGDYSVWVKYGGYNCTADAHATVNPGWDYLTDSGHITSGNYVDCIEDDQAAVDPPAFETTAATCRWGKNALYQWQEKTRMSGSWSNISGATDQDYDPEPRGAGSSWYRRLAKCDCGSGYASNASTNVRDIHIKEAKWDNVVLGSNVSNCDGDCDGSIKVDANFNKTGEYTVQYTLNGNVITAPGTYTGVGFNTIGGLCAGTYTDITITGVHTGCSSVWPHDIVIEPYNDNLTDAGHITTSHFVGCFEEGNTVDPPTFEATPATCSDGSPAVYQWQEKTSMSGSWNNISGATNKDYDPEPRGPGSSWYRRLAKCDCDSDFASSNSRDVHIKEAVWDDVVLGSNVSNCDGECDGSIMVNANFNKTGEYTVQYTLNGDVITAPGTYTGVGFNTIGGLCAGTYTDITITGVNTGCSAVWPDDIVITEPTAPEIMASGDELICEGETVTLTAATSGGTAPLSVVWMPGGQTTSSITVSPEMTTTYTVTVTDANNCTDADHVTVTVKDQPTATIHASVTAICSEESVTFNAGPSATGSKYDWDFGEYAVDRFRSGAGPHEVTFALPDDLNGNDWTKAMLTVTNNGCVDVALKTIDIRDLPEVTSVESTDPACEGDNGSITVFFVNNPNRSHISFSLNGAAGPFTRVPDTDGSLTFDDLGAGDYDLFVKWGNHQCGTELDDVTLTDQPGPEVIASGGELVCAGESVTLTASASGGTAPLTITWMPGGETGESITVAPDETTIYTATVTDANGCTASDDATVETFTDNLTDAGHITTGNFSECVEEGQTADPPTFDATPATCSDGSPAVYQWQEKTSMSGVWADIPGATDEDYDPEPRGISSSWYRRQAKCDCDSDFASSNVRDVHVRELPEVTVESTDPACEGSNGSITVFFVDNPARTHISFSLNGAAGPFTTVPDSDGSLTFDELSEGSYDLFVKWGNGQCGTDLDDVTLTDQPGPEVTAPDAELICEDESVTLTATASGGTAPLSILWMPGGETGASITVSPDMTTTYTVKVTDANGCMDTDEVVVTVNDTPAFEVTKVDATCGEDNGSATASGDAGLTYEWSNGKTTATIINLSAGSYSVTATSSAGCTDTKTVVIETSQGVEVSVEGAEICVGASATLTADISGGEAPFVITWTPGGETTESISVSPDATTDYSVMVTDANGCTATADVTVTVNDAPAFTVTKVDATCDEDNGSATASGDAGLTYEWSNGATTPTIDGLAAGTYSVTATNPDGCTDDKTIIITSSPGSEVDIVCDNSEIVTRMASMVQDCRGPYMAGFWASNMVRDISSSARFDVINGKFVENLAEGTAVFTATVVNEEEAGVAFELIATFTGRTSIPPPGSPKENDLCIGDVDNSDWYYYNDFSGQLFGIQDLTGAVVDVIAVGEKFQLGTGANLFDENEFGGSGWLKFLIVSQPDDVSKVLVNNGRGDINVNLTDPAPETPDCLNICAGESSILTATASGSPEFDYLWSTGETTATITVSPDMTTVYSVSITDANGCEAVDEVEVVVNDVPSFSVVTSDASCFDPNGSAMISGASSNDLTYTWSNGAMGMAVSDLPAGTYSVTGTSPAGCSATEVFFISSTPRVRANIICDNPAVVIRDVSLVPECDRPFMAGFWASNMMSNVSPSARFDIIDGTFTENPADGTAVFTARLINQGNSSANFDVTINYSGRTSTPPVGSPKEDDLCIGDIDNSDWYYYPVFTGQMIGLDDMAGAVVDIIRVGEAFQIGTGANLYDENEYGASSWLRFQIQSQPDDASQVLNNNGRGDINVNMSGSTDTPPVTSDCFNIIPGQTSVLTATTTSGTPEFSYLWSTGATTQTITVSPQNSATYTVTITDANGCSDSKFKRVIVTDPGSARTDFTEIVNGSEGVDAENLSGTETVTTKAEEAKLSAPIFEAPATVLSNDEFVFELAQNAPNPFSDETTIRFTLPEAGNATLVVLDLAGRPVREIRQDFAAGQNVVQLDGNSLAAGTYVYTLMFNGQRLTRRMIHMPR